MRRREFITLVGGAAHARPERLNPAHGAAHHDRRRRRLLAVRFQRGRPVVRRKRRSEMKYRECMIAWTPGDAARRKYDTTAGCVEVGPRPDLTGWSRKYECTTGSYYTEVQGCARTQRRKIIFSPVFDELIERRCNHYRQMMGCTPSGPSEFVP
jgi:hypothetical protein